MQLINLEEIKRQSHDNYGCKIKIHYLHLVIYTYTNSILKAIMMTRN